MVWHLSQFFVEVSQVLYKKKQNGNSSKTIEKTEKRWEKVSTCISCSNPPISHREISKHEYNNIPHQWMIRYGR